MTNLPDIPSGKSLEEYNKTLIRIIITNTNKSKTFSIMKRSLGAVKRDSFYTNLAKLTNHTFENSFGLDSHKYKVEFNVRNNSFDVTRTD